MKFLFKIAGMQEMSIRCGLRTAKSVEEIKKFVFFYRNSNQNWNQIRTLFFTSNASSSRKSWVIRVEYEFAGKRLKHKSDRYLFF